MGWQRAGRTCSGFTLMIPISSRKFSNKDFAIRFRINARSVCFPLLPVGVAGGV